MFMQNHNFESVGSILNTMLRDKRIGKSINTEQLDMLNPEDKGSAERFEEWMRSKDIRMGRG